MVVGSSVLNSEKTAFGSKNRGSNFLGAMNSLHTTKISAETPREEGGLVASTFLNNCWNTHINLL